MVKVLNRVRESYSGLIGRGGVATLVEQNSVFNDLTGSTSTYSAMSRDGAVSQLVRDIRYLMLGVDFTLSGGDVRVDDYLSTEVFKKDSYYLGDLLNNISLMFVYGWVIFERVVYVEDGLFKVKFYLVHPSSVSMVNMRDDGTLVSFQQIGEDGKSVFLENDMENPRFVIFSYNNIGGNPFSDSYIRPCYRAWVLKTELEELLKKYTANLMGVPVYKMSSGDVLSTSGDSQYSMEKAENVVSQLSSGGDSLVTIDSDEEFSIETPKTTTGSVPLTDLIKEQTKTILEIGKLGYLATGETSYNQSSALIKDKERQDVHHVELVTSQLQRYLVDYICGLNGRQNSTLEFSLKSGVESLELIEYTKAGLVDTNAPSVRAKVYSKLNLDANLDKNYNYTPDDSSSVSTKDKEVFGNDSL